MTGIIFYESDFIKANEELKKIVDKYNFMLIPVEQCHYKKSGSYARFENGDTWQVVKATETARGYRCNIAYIERCINRDIYHYIICHSMIDLPYSAIRLWGEGNLHIIDNEIPQLPF